MPSLVPFRGPTNPTQRRTSMAPQDTLRYTRIPLAHGSGAIPAVGFGTLIPDPVATKQATKTALDVGFRHLDWAERYRNEEAAGESMKEPVQAGAVPRLDIILIAQSCAYPQYAVGVECAHVSDLRA